MSCIIKKCYLCSGDDFESVEGKVRDIPDLPIMRCTSCGLVFLGSHEHIDSSFYEGSKMRADNSFKDWQRYLKEYDQDDERRVERFKPLLINKSVLDFGCGGGGFLLKVKNICKSSAGLEKDKYLRGMLTEAGIAVYGELEELKDKFDVITLFHVLEHLKDPRDILKKLSDLLNKSGTIIIEVPNSDDALLELYKSKPFSEFTYWGCHLYLFNNSTLKKLINDSGLIVNFIGQIQRYPLSNHLYWLSKGKPGGHKIWHFMDRTDLSQAYEAQLATLGLCDTIIASVSKREDA